MPTVTSRDGTIIAYDRRGSGPPLILVDGALGQRVVPWESAPLATHPLLTQRFAVIAYDRRGRGESGDTPPYALEREIEDIDALISATGEPAFLYGISSGAALAFEAALALGPERVRKLAMYEPPYNDAEASRQAWIEYRAELDRLLAADRRGDAVALFMTMVGVPAEEIPAMREYPMWPAFEAIAHTLAYDAAAMGDDASVPVERAARLRVPTLVMDGGATEQSFLHDTAVTLAKAIPGAQHRTLEGQTHQVSPDALAPVLAEFFES